MKKYLIIIFIFIATISQAADYYATTTGSGTTCSEGSPCALEYTLETKADNGDIVHIAAGTYTLGAGTTLVVTKGISIIGAGSETTIIVGNLSSTSAYLFSYIPATPASNTAFLLSGVTIDPNDTGRGIHLQNSTQASIQTNVRIDDVIVDNAVSWALWVDGAIYGVVHDSTFKQGNIRLLGNDEDVWNNIYFVQGSSNGLYFEDNVFYATSDDYFYLEGGSITTFRYNTIYTNIKATGYYPLFDTHDDQDNAHHASMGAEIYGNEIISGSYAQQVVGHRGGELLFFYNSATTTGGYWLKVWERYNDSLTPPATAPNGQPQHPSDSYIFANAKNGTIITNDGNFPYTTTIDYGEPEGLVPRENVHFWKQAASFNGTVGVGCGTLANRPATCTAGVGYWATDQSCTDLTDYVGVSPTTPISGTLYKCVANNTWAAYYTPYTYPHPLRTDDSPPADTTAPTFSTASISTSGETLTINLTEDVTVNTNTGFAITCSGGAATLTYSAESNGVLTYGISRAIQQAEGNCTLAYTTGANYIEDAAGNDLDSFTDQTVVNGSEQTTPPLATLTITAHTGATVISSPSGINCGSTCSYDFDTNTPVVIQGYCLANYQNPVISGDCNASTGAVTMSAAKSCAYSCSKIAADAAVGSGAGHAVGTGAAHYIY